MRLAIWRTQQKDDGHVRPHFNDAGGCLCRCPGCVRDVRPDSAYLRCVCPTCTEDCPGEKLDRQKES